MANGTNSHEGEFLAWLKNFLQGSGNLTVAQSGSKIEFNSSNKHDIDTSTGYWRNPNHSRNIPPRWIYQIVHANEHWTAVRSSPDLPMIIGVANTAQENTAGVIFRILPLVKRSSNGYILDHNFEIRAIFTFHGAVPKGSSAQSFKFNPSTGEMEYIDHSLPYLSAALLGIRARSSRIVDNTGAETNVPTYGEIIDAIADDITISPLIGASGRIPTFDLHQKSDKDRLQKQIEDAWNAAGPAQSPGASAKNSTGQVATPRKNSIAPEVQPCDDLIGIDPSVYRQINAAVASGKRHIMLYGPPGTGKTTLAQHVAETLGNGIWTLVTASADWTSQDVIGGYQIVGSGAVGFIPGVLLQKFDEPLIIDEMNRCDIDKVIGPLFTVLSGQKTTLPYRVNVADKDSRQHEIFPYHKDNLEDHEHAPGDSWRIIGTMNSIDKASLYQMSYAFARRFGWIYVGVPEDKHDFLKKLFPESQQNSNTFDTSVLHAIADFWVEVNKVREIGPSPIIDMVGIIKSISRSMNVYAEITTADNENILDALDMALIPMLDGISSEDANTLADKAIEIFKIEEEKRIKGRINSVAI